MNRHNQLSFQICFLGCPRSKLQTIFQAAQDYSDIIYHKHDPEYTLELTKKVGIYSILSGSRR